MNSSKYLINNLFSVKGRVAAITGGSGHLMSQFAFALSLNGVKVAILDTDYEKGASLKNKIEDAGGNSIFIETGTFTGYTLIKNRKMFKKIYSFEPSKKFYKISKNRLKKFRSIILFNQISEKGLPKLLKKISGNVTFWLDGHYSGNETYQGPNKVPIIYELNSIINKKKRY